MNPINYIVHVPVQAGTIIVIYRYGKDLPEYNKMYIHARLTSSRVTTTYINRNIQICTINLYKQAISQDSRIPRRVSISISIRIRYLTGYESMDPHVNIQSLAIRHAGLYPYMKHITYNTYNMITIQRISPILYKS